MNTGNRFYTALFLSSIASSASCADSPMTSLTVDSVGEGDAVDTPADSVPLAAAFPSPGGVSDLTVSSATQTSVTVTWTQVEDGREKPALYQVKYAEPAIEWSTAKTGCAPSTEGMNVGSPISCTVEGLDPAQDYDFLAMSYRLAGNGWAGAKYSNIASGTTASEEEEGGEDVVALGPAAVTDLAIGVATGSSVTLEWTQIDDGMGEPARYRVKYASPAIEDWGTATVGCGRNIIGSEIGAPISCTAEGLSPSTAYEFQLMSYRLASDGTWAGAQYSNLTATRTVSASDALSAGIWIDHQALMQQPTSGADWEVLLTDAGRSPGSAHIADQDSNHDVYSMAAALVCVRSGEYCSKARHQPGVGVHPSLLPLPAALQPAGSARATRGRRRDRPRKRSGQTLQRKHTHPIGVVLSDLSEAPSPRRQGIGGLRRRMIAPLRP